MAGNYPDAPSWRMAYDRDGTQVYKIDSSNTITPVAASIVTALNSENGPGQNFAQQQNVTLVFIFPELRDVDAFYHSVSGGVAIQPNSCTVQVSVNTTNGFDGTWTTISTNVPPVQPAVPGFRTGILSSTALAVRAIRWVTGSTTGAGFAPNAIHLYGEPAPGENPNRLALWHPTLDQRVTPAFFDWGNVPRNSSADKTFRVKNLSGVQTANSIRVAMEALTDAVPSVPAQHTLSFGGGSFLAQINIGTLAPGAIGPVVTLRRVTPSNAQLSLWAMRVFAEAGTWS